MRQRERPHSLYSISLLSFTNLQTELLFIMIRERIVFGEAGRPSECLLNKTKYYSSLFCFIIRIYSGEVPSGNNNNNEWKLLSRQEGGLREWSSRNCDLLWLSYFILRLINRFSQLVQSRQHLFTVLSAPSRQGGLLAALLSRQFPFLFISS